MYWIAQASTQLDGSALGDKIYARNTNRAAIGPSVNSTILPYNNPQETPERFSLYLTFFCRGSCESLDADPTLEKRQTPYEITPGPVAAMHIMLYQKAKDAGTFDTRLLCSYPL
jgi:hypothetical protein